MNELIIRRAKLVNGDIVDIAISDGVIREIGQISSSLKAEKEIDLAGKYYVSAGWIDAHTHCYSSSPIYYDEPDKAGVETGVTTLVDAGSVGADDMDDFYQNTQKVKTNVFAFINISRIGIIAQNELSDMNNIDQPCLDKMIAKYPDFIIGIKARISKSVVEENGIKPLIRAKEMQQTHNQLPVMVHVGNSPPDLGEIVDLLDKGDIITHCFNGKPNRILDAENNLREPVRKAIERGVLMDIGHGGESFSFAVAERAMELGVWPDTISSDIYYRNRINGPVYSLAAVLSKFICLGYSVEQIIERITTHPADLLKLKNKGHLTVGYDADLTIFAVEDQPITLTDAQGISKVSQKQFVPLAAIVAGQCYATKEGQTENVFNL